MADLKEPQTDTNKTYVDLKAMFAMAHDLALKGPTITMLTLGAVMILVVTAGRLTPLIRVDDDTYNTSIIVGMVLLLLSAAIRVYEFKVQNLIDREVRQAATQTLKEQQQAAVANQNVGSGTKVQT